jgi:hypothetical protein
MRPGLHQIDKAGNRPGLWSIQVIGVALVDPQRSFAEGQDVIESSMSAAKRNDCFKELRFPSEAAKCLLTWKSSIRL